MLNRVIMMGRLVADPEQRTAGAATLVRFRIAVDRNFTPQGQERKSDFFTCIAWRQTGDFVMKYFRRGSMIAVEGEFHNNNYTDKDGKMQYTDELQIDRVYFTGEKANNPQAGYQQGNNPQDGGYARQSNYAPPAQQPIPPVQQPASSIAVGEGKNFVEIADDTDLPF